MKQVGYGKGYQYAHDLESKVADMECMPDNLRGREYYHPTSEGKEKVLGQRMEELKRLRKQAKNEVNTRDAKEPRNTK
jgi:putative ATPase